MNVETKIACIRSFGYWVRECDRSRSPVTYIVVDPGGSEEGWMTAGDEDILDLTIDELEAGNPEAVAAFRNGKAATWRSWATTPITSEPTSTCTPTDTRPGR